MKTVFLFAMVLAPGVADAQLNQSLAPTITAPSRDSFARDIEGYPFSSTVDTPTMRKEKLDRAISFRREAVALLAQDGGKFTPEHQAYVQRKARDILANRR